MALELMDYVKIVASSAVIGSTMGALVSGAFAWRKDHRETQRERFVSTLIAVETLENFTRACVQMMSIDDEAQEEAVRYNDLDSLNRVHLPAFSYPDSVDWKWVKSATAARLREFTNAWNASLRSVINSGDYEDRFGACDTITAACATLGQKAWRLASDVRFKTSLPQAELHGHEAGMLALLEGEIERRAKLRAEWEAKWKARQAEPPFAI